MAYSGTWWEPPRDAADLLHHPAGGAHIGARIDLRREWHGRSWWRGRSISAAPAPMALHRDQCSRLTETLVESELFGTRRARLREPWSVRPGVLSRLTGARCCSMRSARCRRLRNETAARARDLRVRRLGGKHEIAVDARVLAATSHQLGTHLREDLLSVECLPDRNPPLREHKEDIPPIAEVMLRNLNKKHSTA